MHSRCIRAKRGVHTPDAGRGYSTERFQTEFYPIAAPLCDGRSTADVLGSTSRLDGRPQVMRRA